MRYVCALLAGLAVLSLGAVDGWKTRIEQQLSRIEEKMKVPEPEIVEWELVRRVPEGWILWERGKDRAAKSIFETQRDDQYWLTKCMAYEIATRRRMFITIREIDGETSLPLGAPKFPNRQEARE